MARNRVTRARSRRGATASTAAIVVLAASVLAGCTDPGAQFDQALGQGYAAVQSARLAVALELEGRTFPTVSTTALEDARRELVDASASVSETDARTPSDAALRTDVLDALALGVDAVNTALDASAGIGTLDAAEPALDEAADALGALGGGR